MSGVKEKLIKCGEKSYTEQNLLKIGNNIASMWGGSCFMYEVTKNEVLFHCIEHGEKFTTSCAFAELEEHNI